MPCEDWGRNRRDAATSQGTPGDSRSWKRQEGSSPGILEVSMGLWTPWLQTSGLKNCESINIYCFKCVAICCGSPENQYAPHSSSLSSFLFMGRSPA